MKQEEAERKNGQRAPVHPGARLAAQLAAIEMNGAQLAERLQVPKNRIYQILEGKRAITADTALRLGRFFGTPPEHWLHLQSAYELERLRQTNPVALEEIRPHQPHAATEPALPHLV